MKRLIIVVKENIRFNYKKNIKDVYMGLEKIVLQPINTIALHKPLLEIRSR